MFLRLTRPEQITLPILKAATKYQLLIPFTHPTGKKECAVSLNPYPQGGSRVLPVVPKRNQPSNGPKNDVEGQWERS